VRSRNENHLRAPSPKREVSDGAFFCVKKAKWFADIFLQTIRVVPRAYSSLKDEGLFYCKKLGGMTVDFKDTLLMPKTDFPMRGNLPNKEPVLQAEWDAANVYQKKFGTH